MAVGDRAVLLTGASGTGKSTIALELMAYGASLVSDDQVVLVAESDVIVASAPPHHRRIDRSPRIGGSKCTGEKQCHNRHGCGLGLFDRRPDTRPTQRHVFGMRLALVSPP